MTYPQGQQPGQQWQPGMQQPAPQQPGPQPAAPQQPQTQQRQQSQAPQQPWQPAQQWQAAPPVMVPPDPGDSPIPKALRVVLVLLFVNLGLSILTAALSYVLRDQLLDYQLASMNLTQQEMDTTRKIVQQTMTIRVVSIAVVAVLYLWLANRLIKGKRWAYFRSLWLGGAGLVGLGILALTTRYPLWMHVEQGVQAAILVCLLIALTRPEVRERFRKVRY